MTKSTPPLGDTPADALLMIDNFPRRNRVDLWTRAEKAIQDAVDVCETTLPADPLETYSIILLAEARAKVAQLVDREIRAGRMAMPTGPTSTPVSEGTPRSATRVYVDALMAGGRPREVLLDQLQRYGEPQNAETSIADAVGMLLDTIDRQTTASTDAGAGATMKQLTALVRDLRNTGYCEGLNSGQNASTVNEATCAEKALLAALTTLHLQHAEQAAKLQELEGYVTLIFGADRLAGAVDRLVRSGKLDARSEAGDALLDYACSRHGDREPIMAVRCVYDVILSKLAAARSSPSGGEPV